MLVAVTFNRLWIMPLLVGTALVYTAFVYTAVANASGDSSYQSTATRESERDAQRLVVEALRIGQKDNDVRRTQLLNLALQKSPNYAPAHWALGHVDQEGEWLPVDDIQQVAKKDSRLMEYENLKQKVLIEPSRHQALARWCEDQGLKDEARAHWIGVLQQDPDHRAALANLSLEWEEGRLIETSYRRSEAKEDREASRERQMWSKKVARWARSRSAADPRRDAVLDEIRSINDLAAIPAFEQLATTLAINSPKRNRACDLCEAFLESLDLMSGSTATESLVQFAVFTEEDRLRSMASESLAGRPLEVSVPMLLSGLQPLTESKFNVARDRQGNVAYQHNVLTKGRSADREYQRTRLGQPVAELVDPNLRGRSRGANSGSNSTTQQRLWSQMYVLDYQKKAEELEEQIEKSNLSAKAINDRIIPALRMVTYQQLDDDPQSWWDYWADYRGYEINRGYEREYDHLEDAKSYVKVPPPNCECFVAGTPVITKRGDKAIETIRPGDFVLSRDPSTRELNFRVVLGVTEREPSPMVKIQCGDETIVSTVGHPFWVETLGWRMAKQLSEGDCLMALDKSIYITGVEPAADAVAYNLIVEGTATYLVGDQGILVHDNTPAEARQRQLVMK